MKGIQTSMIVSLNDRGKGFQGSMVTVSQDFEGLQLGLINYARKMHGIQVGLINVIKRGGMLPVFPLFNYSFEK